MENFKTQEDFNDFLDEALSIKDIDEKGGLQKVVRLEFKDGEIIVGSINPSDNKGNYRISSDSAQRIIEWEQVCNWDFMLI